MPITYPIDDFPIEHMSSIEIRKASVVGVSRSPFTGSQQVQAHAGQWWELDLFFSKMLRSEAEQVASGIVRLNGMEGTLLLPPHKDHVNRGPGGGSPVVDGNDQTGNDLVIKSATPTITGYLLTGDYISLGTGGFTRLFKVLEDVDTDGAGGATLVVWPKLRLAAPQNNDLVEVEEPKGTFRLAENVSSWTIDTALIYETGFSVIEAI